MNTGNLKAKYWSYQRMMSVNNTYSIKKDLINCSLMLAMLPGAANAQSSFCSVNEQINTAPFVIGMDEAITPDGTKHPYRICNVQQFTSIADNPTL